MCGSCSLEVHGLEENGGPVSFTKVGSYRMSGWVHSACIMVVDCTGTACRSGAGRSHSISAEIQPASQPFPP